MVQVRKSGQRLQKQADSKLRGRLNLDDIRSAEEGSDGGAMEEDADAAGPSAPQNGAPRIENATFTDAGATVVLWCLSWCAGTSAWLCVSCTTDLLPSLKEQSLHCCAGASWLLGG